MSIPRFPDERQADVPQDLVRDGSTTLPHEDAITRVAKSIFRHIYGDKAWDESTFDFERADCLLLAVQYRDVFAEKWTPFDASVHLTAQMVHVLYGQREITPEHRDAVQRFCEKFISDASRIFGNGDMKQILDAPSKAVN